MTPIVTPVIEYSFPDEYNHLVNSGEPTEPQRHSLMRPETRTNTFGVNVGDTYYEYQHNHSMHRQITTGSAATPEEFTVHFAWTFLASEVPIDRSYFYAAYNADSDTYYGPQDLQSPGEYAGYVSIDVNSNNRAIISGHNDQGSGYQIHTYFQSQPFSFAGGYNTRTSRPDCGVFWPCGAYIWPALAYQESPFSDPIVHVIGCEVTSNQNGRRFWYARKMGFGTDSTWTIGWLDPDSTWRDQIDTIKVPEAYDIAASKTTGKVAIVWAANLTDNSCPGDTCSHNATMGSTERDKWDNDLYLQTSDDYGISWNPHLNITKNVAGEDGFRPFGDISALISSDDVFHVAYVAMLWDEPEIGSFQSRIFHWSEELYLNSDPHPVTVSTALWEPENCTPGRFNLNQAKLAISECGGNLYVMWTELNSPMTPGNEFHDDCAARAFSGDPDGAANGDLFVSVSTDLLGADWDRPRGLTNSYGGPSGNPAGTGACDPLAAPCPAEHWPSMAPFGSNYPVIDQGNVVTSIDPAYAGTDYLDIAYIADSDPGGSIFGEGTWQQADYMWIRVPCVDPVFQPGFLITPKSFEYPDWIKNCIETPVDLTIENTGNTDLTYTYELIEDPGPASGWLSASGFSGLIPTGIADSETGQLILNTGASICNPGSISRATGRMVFTHNGYSNRAFTVDTFEIEMIVADTVIPTTYDTLATTCLSLIVGNNGNVGNQAQGGVNMDYELLDWKYGMDVYLNDGGTVIGWTNSSGDTIVNWGMYSTSIADSVSLIPLGGQSRTTLSWAEMYNTGVYVTNDSSIAMSSSFYFPNSADSCSIIIKKTIVYSNDGTGHKVTVGEVVDYDIPNDSNDSYNSSGDGSDPVFAETGAQLIYIRGVNFPYPPHDSVQVSNGGWDADERFGVLQYLGGQRTSGAITTEDFYVANGLYSASNLRFVYPYDLGFNPDSLYTLMSFTGSNVSDSVQDLHAGISCVYEYDLAAADTISFFVAYITNLNATYPYSSKATSGIAGSVVKATALYEQHLGPSYMGCCDWDLGIPGDFNGDGVFDIGDLTDIVHYLFQGGSGPLCYASGDFNGNGTINIADLTDMVSFMFHGGQGPVCPPW